MNVLSSIFSLYRIIILLLVGLPVVLFGLTGLCKYRKGVAGYAEAFLRMIILYFLFFPYMTLNELKLAIPAHVEFKGAVNFETAQIFLVPFMYEMFVALITTGVNFSQKGKVSKPAVLMMILSFLIPAVLIFFPALYSFGIMLMSYLLILVVFMMTADYPVKSWPLWLFAAVAVSFRMWGM